MNALNVSVDRMNAVAHRLVRRFPLAARSLELVLMTALYIAGMFAVARLSDGAGLVVTMYALFAMPVVLSVGLRLYRAIERRLAHLREQARLTHAG